MPPQFPVVAPPATGKTTPSIPHISATAEPTVEEPPPAFKSAKPPQKNLIVIVSGLAALLVLGGGGFFVWTTYLSPTPPPPPPPVAAKPKPPAPAATPAPAPAGTTPAATAPAPNPGPQTPSDTLNALAKAPVNAINKAQGVVDARRTSDQTRVDALTSGEDLPAKPAKPATTPTTPPPGAPAVADKPAVRTSGSIAPGVSATIADVEAVPDATPAFRTFVANAKITGVIGGTPPKVLLNGRLMRAGESVETALGITFDGIDPDRKLLIFKDKSGAIVTRKY